MSEKKQPLKETSKKANVFSARNETEADAIYSNEKSGISFTKKAILITISIVIAALLLGVCFVAAYVRTYEGIYPNVYVGEIKLGGMSDGDQILEKLNSVYFSEKIKDLTIPVTCRETSSEIQLNDLQVVYDNQVTLSKAHDTGRRGNLILRTLNFILCAMHKTDIPPQITYNKENLDNAINGVVAPYEIEPVGHTFKIMTNEVTIIGDVNGIKVNRKDVTKKIEKQIREMNFSEIVMEPKSVKPEPLNFDEFYNWLTGDAQNAYYEKNAEGKVVVHLGRLKCEVPKEEVERAIKSIKKSPDNMVVIPAKTTEPELTSTKLEEILYKDVLGSYYTWYTGSAARLSNVELATARVNGSELMPGEEFSYGKTILPRNAKNGYKMAPVIEGDKTAYDFGGGICQPSSTLHAAVKKANLKIVERHPHSKPVGYIPTGWDATIAESTNLDFRFKNNTNYPIKIEGVTAGGKVTFTIWGYKGQ